MTLGAAAAAQVRLIVWCKACRRQVEPDPAEMAARYGANTSVLDWRERLVCSGCGSREVDFRRDRDVAAIAPPYRAHPLGLPFVRYLRIADGVPFH